SYSTEVLADNPVGYWPLNEISGTTAASATGSRNGTYVGLPSLGQSGLVSSPGDLAPDLDGVDDQVTANDVASGIDWSNGFTMEGWVQVTQVVKEEDIIGFNNSTGSVNLPGLIRDEPTDRFKYRDGESGSANYHFAQSNTIPTVGGIYYVAVTVNG